MAKVQELVDVADLDLETRVAHFARPLLQKSPGIDPEVLTRDVLESATELELAGQDSSTRSTWRSSSTSSTRSSMTVATSAST